jgi:hypothetical protein
MKRFPKLMAILAGLWVSSPICQGETLRRYQILVAAGDPAPTVAPNVKIGRIWSQPRISANGHVVFGTRLDHHGTADKAIWSGTPGNFKVVALHGAPAPGRPGETLDLGHSSTGSSLAICPDGTAAFFADLAPSGDDGIWMGSHGVLNKVLAVNDGLPAAGGVRIKGFKSIPFVANGDGQIVLRAELKGDTIGTRNDSAIWAGKAGDLTLLHWEEQESNPYTGGLMLGDVTFSDLTMNGRGELAFEVLDRGPGVPGDANSVVMSGTREGLRVRLREGDPVAGLPGVVWGNLKLPQLANDGTLTFFSIPSTSANGRYGIQHPDGTSAVLATDGVEAEGAPGLLWDIPTNRSPFNTPMLGGAGTAAFVAGLGLQENHHRDGVWIHHQRELRLVARKFQPAPGDPGETFLDLGGASYGEGPAVTEDGVVVFWSETSDRKHGLWRWHAGDLQPLILDDDLIEWRAGERKTVIANYAKLGGTGQSGGPSGLNDRGQLVFRVFLSGGVDAILMIDNVMDRDGDGVECLVEEAFGGDPDDPTDGRSASPTWSAGAGRFEVSYLQRNDGAFDYGVECSPDLEEWSPVDAIPSPSGDTGNVLPGTTRMVVGVPRGDGQMYFRVRVTRTSNP